LVKTVGAVSKGSQLTALMRSRGKKSTQADCAVQQRESLSQSKQAPSSIDTKLSSPPMGQPKLLNAEIMTDLDLLGFS
jgi:hypothetical protein